MTKKPGHLHIYKRVKLGKNYLVYKCQVPGCAHYRQVELCENARIACYICKQEMVLTKDKMELAKPHCDSCTKRTHKQQELDVLNQILGEL